MQAGNLTVTCQLNAFRTACLSATGGRSNNEDFCGSQQVEQSVCWAVADGLGGYNAGELASKAAVETVLQSFRVNPELTTAAIEGHINSAQGAVQTLQQRDPAMAGMRTTLVVLIGDSHRALWAHVGDSRLYHFQARGLAHQTDDHSVPQSLAKAGEISTRQIRGHPDRNRLLRSLGDPGAARPSVLPAPVLLSDGDAFLLCTDGFWEYVLETEMLADLTASSSPEEWLDRAACRLRTRAHGEFDNYSALAVFYVAGALDRVSPQAAGKEQTRKKRGWWLPSLGSRRSVRTGGSAEESEVY